MECPVPNMTLADISIDTVPVSSLMKIIETQQASLSNNEETIRSQQVTISSQQETIQSLEAMVTAQQESKRK